MKIFIVVTAVLTISCWGVAHAANRDEAIFVAFGDPHYGAAPTSPGNIRSAKAIAAVNALPRHVWPSPLKLSGQFIRDIRGVLILGDVTDNGEAAQWQRFESDFGLLGENLLHYPIYEGYGNHDFSLTDRTPDEMNSDNASEQDIFVIKMIQSRNTQRATSPTLMAATGAHYSWNWGKVHVVNLNLAASNIPKIIKRTNYRYTDPNNALTFLKADLDKCCKQGQPVVILQHYPPRIGKRFFIKDAKELLTVIQPFNVVALLHAHTHETSTYTWCGIPVFDVGSPHYNLSKNMGMGHFSLFRITSDFLEAASFGWPAQDPTKITNEGQWQKIVDLKQIEIDRRSAAPDCFMKSKGNGDDYERELKR